MIAVLYLAVSPLLASPNVVQTSKPPVWLASSLADWLKLTQLNPWRDDMNTVGSIPIRLHCPLRWTNKTIKTIFQLNASTKGGCRLVAEKRSCLARAGLDWILPQCPASDRSLADLGFPSLLWTASTYFNYHANQDFLTLSFKRHGPPCGMAHPHIRNTTYGRRVRRWWVTSCSSEDTVVYTFVYKIWG